MSDPKPPTRIVVSGPRDYSRTPIGAPISDAVTPSKPTWLRVVDAPHDDPQTYWLVIGAIGTFLFVLKTIGVL